MSVSRLQKQLARDLKKSPKKAAALGLLCLVAVYFWAPLVMNYFSGKKPTEKDQAEVAVVAAAQAPTQAAATAGSAAAAREGLSVPWKDLVKWMELDRRMMPAAASVGLRMPFGSLESGSQTIDDETLASTRPGDADATPEQLGLKLSGTMLGGGRRVAVINGRPYAEGRPIALSENRVFVLKQVAARHVVLERQGERYELAVADDKPSLAGNSGEPPAGLELPASK